MATLLRTLRHRLILWLYMLPFITRPKRVRRARRRLITFALTTAPIGGADGDGDGDDDGDDDDDDGDDDGDAAGSGDDNDGDDDDGDGDDAAGGSGDDAGKGARGRRRGQPDWKRESRKHERNYKKAMRRVGELEKSQKDRNDADKSTREKELDEARSTARGELEEKHKTERRADRLEVAVTKAAAKGLKIGDGDDAKTLKFADPDDALLHLDRAIRSGELDPDDIFDNDGRVRSDALDEALTEILESKPHLAAESGNGGSGRRVKGGADGGKGKAPNTDMTVESRLKQIRRHSKAA